MYFLNHIKRNCAYFIPEVTRNEKRAYALG